MIPQTISHYKILRMLGRGGMGEVYLAEDTSLGRNVAIKGLPEEMKQDLLARKRLMREAKAAAVLDHPYICHIHEVGEADDQPFIVMEYIEGQTLKERIKRGPLPLDEALQTAGEVAEALQEAHEKGVIHRDLKPANIMLTKQGHAKVMDFGIAARLPSSEKALTQEETLTMLTEAGTAVGTLAYMSPEQLRGQSGDQRSDIFSFGLVLYEMLTGCHPFRKDAGMTTVSAILTETPPPLVQHTRQAPEFLQRMIDKALAKNPAERYPSMKELCADLKKLSADLHSGARPMRFLRALWMRVTALVFGFAALALAWLVIGHYFRSPAAALSFQERDWILITDFENLTGEQVFDGTLETALTVSIQQSQYVNVFPRSRVWETLKRMRKENVTKLDENLAKDVALREGIKGLLACNISKIGEDYLLAVRVIDPATQAMVYSQSTRASGKENILGSLDKLSETIRQKLGESLAQISRQRVPLLQATTSSLEALKSLTEARRIGGSTGIELLKQAIDLDPDFALAHADLGVQYYINNNRGQGEWHFKKALSLLDRLTAREKLWIRAAVEDWRGNRDQGIENYKAYLAQYPDDSLGWFRLGYAYQITDRPSLGVEAFRRVIEIDSSSAAASVNLASCYSLMGRNEEAIENYEKAFGLDPLMATGLYVNHEYGFLLVRLGQIQKAEQNFERMLSTDDVGKKARGHRSLALLNMYRGKYSMAGDHFSQAVLLDQTSKFLLSEMRDRLFLAGVHRMKGRAGDSEREMKAVQQILNKLKVEPTFLYFSARVFARNGKLREAARLLDELKARLGDVLASSSVNRSDQSDQDYYNLLRGEVELAQGHYDQAVSLFKVAGQLRDGLALECQAYASRQAGNLDDAIGKYQEFLLRDALGGEAQEPWILAHYELGSLYEKKGRMDEAVKYYQKFLDIWREADPDLAILSEARQRLAGLK